MSLMAGLATYHGGGNKVGHVGKGEVVPAGLHRAATKHGDGRLEGRHVGLLVIADESKVDVGLVGKTGSLNVFRGETDETLGIEGGLQVLKGEGIVEDADVVGGGGLGRVLSHEHAQARVVAEV